MSHTEEMRRLIAGPLVKTFLQNMNLHGELYNPRKIYLYSGSDTNFAAVIRALKIDGFEWPDFSSTLILEKLRDSDRRLYVRVSRRIFFFLFYLQDNIYFDSDITSMIVIVAWLVWSRREIKSTEDKKMRRVLSYE